MEQDVFIYGNGAWITYKFLMERKVPKQTILNNTASKKKTRWYTRCYPGSKKVKLIAYDSLPISIITKYKLPEFSELKVIAEISKKLIKDKFKEKAKKIITDIFDFEISNWESVRSIYCNLFSDDEKIRKYCKTHVLFAKILELNNKNIGFKLSDLFDAYRGYDDLVFETNTVGSFYNKVLKVKNAKCIEEELINGHRNQISNNRKVTEDVIIEIKRLRKNPKQYSADFITPKINDYLIRTNRKTISQATVERIINELKVDNEVAIIKYGIQYVKNKMMPFAHFIPPHKEGILWQVDGTRFQFAYKGGPKDISFLTYYIVIDAFDKRIIGCSYDDGENTEMAIVAFEMACRAKKYLPTEINSDNSPAYRAKDYVSMVINAKSMGVNWRINKVKNPRDNTYVERTFKVIQEKYCKKYDGYVGDGIKSKDINGRPSPEELTKYFKNKNLRTRAEVIALIHKIVKEYNESKDRTNLMKKDEFILKQYGKRNINPIPLDSSKNAILFWACRDLKLQNGMISFDVDNEPYYYNIYDDNVLVNYHGSRVRVRYNKTDLSKVMLFEIGSNKYICTLERYIAIPKAGAERDDEQNSQLYTHISKSRELEKRLKERVLKIEEESKKNWQKVPPELAEFAPLSKPIRENSEKEIVEKELEKISEKEKFRIITF